MKKIFLGIIGMVEVLLRVIILDILTLTAVVVGVYTGKEIEGISQIKLIIALVTRITLTSVFFYLVISLAINP